MAKSLKTAIPETNVDGIAVICYKVEIPDTILWRRTLYTLVSLLVRGRYWDEETGNIRDVQQVAFAVLDSLQPCQEQTGNGDGDRDDTIIKYLIDKCKRLELNNMCNCNNCCGNGSGNNTIPPDPTVSTGGVVPDLSTDEAVTVPTYSGYADIRCKKSYYMVRNFVRFMRGLPSLFETAEDEIGELSNYHEFVFGGLSEYQEILYVGFLMMVSYAERYLSTGVAIEIADFTEANERDVVCLMQSGDSVWEIRQALLEYYTTTSGLSRLSRLTMYGFVWAFPIFALFQGEAETASAPAYADVLAITDTCGSCAGGVVVGSVEYNIPVEYELVRLPLESWASSGGATLDEFSGTYVFRGDGGSGVTIQHGQAVNSKGDIVTRNDQAGVIFHKLSETLVANTNGFGHNTSSSSEEFFNIEMGNPPFVWDVDKLAIGVRSGLHPILDTWASTHPDMQWYDSAFDATETPSPVKQTGFAFWGTDTNEENVSTILMWAIVPKPE